MEEEVYQFKNIKKNTMNKKTKMWLGVGVVAVAAYYFWNKNKQESTTTTAFASASGKGVPKFGRAANLPSGLNRFGEKLTYGY